MKKNMNRKRAMYIMALILAIFFAFSFGGSGGIYFMYALVIAPIISAIWFYISIRSFELEIITSKEVLEKGEQLIVSYVFKQKNGKLPALISVKPRIPQNLVLEGKEEFEVYVAKVDGDIIEQKYTTQYWGVSELRIEEVIVTDILGLFSHKKNLGVRKEVYVLPRIYEMNNILQLVNCIRENNVSYEEEEVSESEIVINGIPGYEYRQYEPGDSIKKINWKLLAKTNKLLVRKDEALQGNKVTLIMDELVDNLDGQRIQETVVEGYISLANKLYLMGFECSLVYKLKDRWRLESITSKEDLERIQLEFATYRFSTNPGQLTIPSVVAGKQIDVDSSFFFTAQTGQSINRRVAQIGAAEKKINLVVADRNPIRSSTRMWIINSEEAVIEEAI